VDRRREKSAGTRRAVECGFALAFSWEWDIRCGAQDDFALPLHFLEKGEHKVAALIELSVMSPKIRLFSFCGVSCVFGYSIFYLEISKP
jgi:hypothetical protein